MSIFFIVLTGVLALLLCVLYTRRKVVGFVTAIKVFKSIALIFSIVLISVSLTACGDKKSNSAISSSSTSKVEKSSSSDEDLDSEDEEESSEESDFEDEQSYDQDDSYMATQNSIDNNMMTNVQSDSSDTENVSESGSGDGAGSNFNHTDMNTGDAGMIVGNSRSGIYHTPGQHGYNMNSANAVFFNNEQEAINAGYRKSLR